MFPECGSCPHPNSWGTKPACDAPDPDFTWANGGIEINQCPRGFLKGWVRGVNRAFELWKHWKNGQLQLLFGQEALPPWVERVVLSVDAEHNAWEHEKLKRQNPGG